MTFAARQHTLTRVSATYVLSASTDQGAVTLGTTIPTTGVYQAGRTDVTITVNAGVYLYSSTTATAALRILGGSAGDVVNMTNNGYIMGCGGNGGGCYATSTSTVANINPTAGGQGLSSAFKLSSISGSGFITGGGGGGGYGSTGNFYTGAGGGGAGGGLGGTQVAGTLSVPNYSTLAGGVAGGLGSTGGNGASGPNFNSSGGGGGRGVPNTAAGGAAVTAPGSGTVVGLGGTGGGSGAAGTYAASKGLAGGGGGYGASGGTGYTNSTGANTSGAGGGTFAAGGSGVSTGATASYAGAAGGAAINTNGQGIGTVSCTVYGSTI